MYAFLMDWKRPSTYFPILVMVHQYIVKFVTGPAKTGHVGTNYTPSLYRSYLSTGIVYLHSVTFIMMPGKCLLRAENCNAIA